MTSEPDQKVVAQYKSEIAAARARLHIVERFLERRSQDVRSGKHVIPAFRIASGGMERTQCPDPPEGDREPFYIASSNEAMGFLGHFAGYLKDADNERLADITTPSDLRDAIASDPIAFIQATEPVVFGIPIRVAN